MSDRSDLSPSQRASITPSDPAAQVVESAHQILTMIGANPRAIRPILAQRRLTKEVVLEAADSAGSRAVAVLAELDADAARRAAVEQPSDEAARAATLTRIQAEQRAQRTFLTNLRDHAVRVAEVYQTL